MGLSGCWSSRRSARRSSASAPRLDVERDLSAWKASRWAAVRSPGRDGGSGWSDRKLTNRRVVCQVPSAEASVRSPPLMPVRAASAAATGARQPARGSSGSIEHAPAAVIARERRPRTRPRRAGQARGQSTGRAGEPTACRDRCARVPSRGLARPGLARRRVVPVIGHQRHAGPHLQFLQGMQVNER